MAAHAEANVWGERRKSVPQQLAYLSQKQSFPLIPQVSKIAAPTLPVKSKESNSLIDLPANLGRVKPVFQKTNNSGPIVLHVQDIHLNLEAQENIAKAIRELSDLSQVQLLALEGSQGAVNLRPFREFGDHSALEKSAALLLKENLISGPIYSGLTARKSIPSIVGIDDAKLHAQNIDAVKEASLNKKSALKEISLYEKALAEEKAKVLTNDQRAADAARQNYHSGKISFGEWIKFLSERQPLSPLSHADVFLTALELEAKIDFSRVERERSIVIERLSAQLSAEESQAFIAQTIEYRNGRLSHKEFYRTFESLCESKSLSLASYPALKSYLQYILLSDSIDGEKLLAEAAQLEKSVFHGLKAASRQQEILRASEWMELVKKLSEFSLTRQEWEHYVDLNKSIHASQKLSQALQPFESFYQIAGQRDEAMSSNLISAMKESGAKASVLVTGGFHTQGIEKTLLAKGFRVISFVPALTKVDTASGSAYLGVFSREKTPLEKLFEGPKLFLAQDGFPPPAQTNLASLQTSNALAAPSVPENQIHKFVAETTGLELQEGHQVSGSTVKMTFRGKFGDAIKRLRITVQDAVGLTSLPKIKIETPFFVAWRGFLEEFILALMVFPTVHFALRGFGVDSVIWAHVITWGIFVVLHILGVRTVKKDGELSDLRKPTTSELAWIALWGSTFRFGSYLLLVTAFSPLTAAIISGLFHGGAYNAIIAPLTGGPLALITLVAKGPDAEGRWRAWRKPRGVVSTQTPVIGVLQNNRISMTQYGVGQPVANTLSRVGLTVLNEGLDLLREYDVLPRFDQEIPIQFSDHNDTTGSLDGETIVLETSWIEENNKATRLVAAITLYHVLLKKSGESDRTAMVKVIDFLSEVKEKDSTAIRDLHQALDSNLIDSDNLFSITIRKALGPIAAQHSGDIKEKAEARKKAETWFGDLYQSIMGKVFSGQSPAFLPGAGESEEERAARQKKNWKERWAVWFLSMRGIDSPVDLERVDEILSGKLSKDEQGVALRSEVFSRKAYDSKNEERNALRKRIEAEEKGHKLTASRYGRASYFLTMLAAGSQFILGLQNLEKTIDELDAILETPHENLPPTTIDELHQLNSYSDQIKSVLSEIRVLTQPNERPTKAQLRGALQRLNIAIVNYQKQSFEFLVVRDNKPSQKHGHPDMRAVVQFRTSQLLGLVDNLEDSVNSMPTQNANFSVLVQRASPTGVRALSHLLMGGDPFEGGEEHIAGVYRRGGEMAYASSDDIWFEVADYWIEALPLFIHNEEETLPDGTVISKIVIEQEAMELALRKLAISWKKNIDSVMDSEHMALARYYMVTEHPILNEIFTEIKRKNPALSDLEVALIVVRQDMEQMSRDDYENYYDNLCHMAAIIENMWRDSAHEIAERQGKGLSRVDAFISYYSDKKNSTNRLLDYMFRATRQHRSLGAGIIKTIELVDPHLDETDLEFRIQNKAKALMNRELAMPWRKMREIPTWIILTTQASGMSDAFAGHYVDEDMALYNITTDFSYKGRLLEKEAEEVKQQQEDRIVAIARKLIVQFGLDYKIDEKNERGSVLGLLKEYSELARETAKVFTMYEFQDNQGKYDPSEEPAPVKVFFEQNEAELKKQAIKRVFDENKELAKDYSADELPDLTSSHVAKGMYRQEVVKYMWVLARDEVMSKMEVDGKPSASLQKMAEWYSQPSSKKGLPRILRMRLSSEKGMTTARQEVIARYWLTKKKKLIPLGEGKYEKGMVPLQSLMNHPVYSYSATGQNKKYNRGYGPSRVDLGHMEEFTTETLPQIIGPADEPAEEAMRFFYNLYNLNVRSFETVREGEHMKPLENALMESMLAITHLYIPLFQAIGSGNFMHLISETNRRSEVEVRIGGGGSSGFCQPKDIYFLPFVTGTAFDEILDYAGVPLENHEAVRFMEKRIKEAVAKAVEDKVSSAELSERISEIFARYALQQTEHKEKHFSLPPSTSMAAFPKIGSREFSNDPDKAIDGLIAQYHGAVIEELEGVMRFAPVHLIHLIRRGIEHAHARDKNRPTWDKSILTLPMEYKPVSDARLAVGLRIMDLLAGSGDHQMLPFGKEGQALARFLLSGFNENDRAMVELFASKVFHNPEKELTPEQLEALKKRFPFDKGQGPAEIRVVSPFNMAAESVYSDLSGDSLHQAAVQAAQLLVTEGMDENVLRANLLTHGAQIEKWQSDGLSKEKIASLTQQLGPSLHALVFDARLNDAEYRNSKGSDLWENIRGADVFSTLIHYPWMTGSEDEPLETNGFGQIPRMVDDLARVRDTMRWGRPNSSLLWFDAPVQGRKPIADRIAISQWLALDGWYASPIISNAAVESIERDMRDEAALMDDLVDALVEGDFDKAEEIFKLFKAIAPDRAKKAYKEEQNALKAADWWRGAGFNNWSERHRLVTQGWQNVQVAKSLSELNIGDLTVMGLMYRLNGEDREDILEKVNHLSKCLSDLKKVSPAQRSATKSREDDAAKSLYLFIKPRHDHRASTQLVEKAASSSLKGRESDAKRAAGQALENMKAILRARATAERVEGYGADYDLELVNADIAALSEAAYKTLGNGSAKISHKQFGHFLSLVEVALNKAIQQADFADSKEWIIKAKAFFDNGKNPTEAAWLKLMGHGDEKGIIGLLASAAKGDRKKLVDLATVGGLMDTALALLMTLEYRQMDEADVELNGKDQVHSDVNDAIAKFFSHTVYDHTADYFPTWMSPAKSGNGFTNYDTIMGRWLGWGKPFTREQVLHLAVKNHQWLNRYLNELFINRTRFEGQLDDDARDALFGQDDLRKGEPPIGAAGARFSREEMAWFTYTQKREIAFAEQQGHKIGGVLTNFDAVKYLHAANRPVVAISAPSGRPHLTVALREQNDFNAEYPDSRAVFVLGRTNDFENVTFRNKRGRRKTERVMVIRDGLVYLDRNTYVAAAMENLKQVQQKIWPPESFEVQWNTHVADAQANFERRADELLKANPKGIPVAVRFKQPLINHVSIPMHGMRFYQEGWDEQIGMPVVQAWIHNLTPGYSKGEEEKVYAGTNLYAASRRFLKSSVVGKTLLALMDDIVEGTESFPGLRELAESWGGSIIAKPDSQSGGRGIGVAKVVDDDGHVMETALQGLAKHIAEQAVGDNMVIQEFLSSSPYIWASPELLDAVRADLIRRGTPLPEGASLTVYSRVISILVHGKMEYVLELTVSSRMAVSNVGLGGALIKWRKHFGSTEEFGQAISDSRRENARLSIPLIEKRAREVWRLIETQDPSLKEWQPEFLAMKERLERAHRDPKTGQPADRTGHPYVNPRYIMHDLLDIPVVRLDDGREIEARYVSDIKYINSGGLEYFRVKVWNEEQQKWDEFKVTKSHIVRWMSIKIEDNIGFGLWQPFTLDEFREEKANAARENRPVRTAAYGGDVRRILYSFVEAAEGYMKMLPKGRPIFPAPFSRRKVEEIKKPAPSYFPRSPEEFKTPLGRAIAQARKLLRKADGEQLNLDELSVLLIQWGIEAVKKDDALFQVASAFPELEDPFILHVAMEKIEKFLASDEANALLPYIRGLTLRQLRNLGLNLQYVEMIGQQIADAIFTESGAQTPLQIAIQPMTPVDAMREMGATRNHALIFDGYLGRKDEILRLISSQFQREFEESRPMPDINVVAAHQDWINPADGSLQKAIIFNRKTGEFKLVEFMENGNQVSLPVHRIQVLALESNEQAAHAQISQLYGILGIPQVNSRNVSADGKPLSAAAIADDKRETTRKLEHLVPVPAIARPNETLGQFISRIKLENSGRPIALRAQPNNGTEGKDHSVFSSDDVDELTQDFHFSTEPFIRQEVGNARVDGARVSLRINVTHSYPGQYSADSGFAMIGAPGSDVSSPGKEGKIVSIPEALSHLEVIGSGVQGVVTPENFEKIKQTAVQALEGLNMGLSPAQQLYSAGIDLELEFNPDGTYKKVWVLDVNPRATGLRHAHTLELSAEPDSVPSHRLLWQPPLEEADLPAVLLRLVTENSVENSYMDESHIHLVRAITDESLLRDALKRLVAYVSLDPKESQDPELLLRQQRAVIIIGDILREFKQRRIVLHPLKLDDIIKSLTKNTELRKLIKEALEQMSSDDSEYLDFINQFLMVALERQTQHQKGEAAQLQKKLGIGLPGALKSIMPGDWKGIKITLVNKAPSRSGLASSSSVSLALLAGLYHLTGQDELLGTPKDRNVISTMAMLFEGLLGLNSGRQDFDGPAIPGVKGLHYPAHQGLLIPEVQPFDVDMAAFSEHVLLFNSGISRTAETSHRRGLNRRHLTYLSRDPETFIALRKSLVIHDEIAEAIKSQNWPLLGRLMLDYMALREQMDPGATQSVFDSAAGKKVLRSFDVLVEKGLIYGWMFSGAMGGGGLMMVPTPKGLEMIGRRTAIDVELHQLREFEVDGKRPFKDLREFNYSVSKEGLKVERRGDEIHVTIPSRWGISSANASDNHTSANERTGDAINLALDLDGEPTVSVVITPLKENKIELVAIDSLETNRPKSVVIDSSQNLIVGEGQPGFFIKDEQGKIRPSYEDSKDPLRMLVYSLVYAGIIPLNGDTQSYSENPEQILTDVASVMNQPVTARIGNLSEWEEEFIFRGAPAFISALIFFMALLEGSSLPLFKLAIVSILALPIISTPLFVLAHPLINQRSYSADELRTLAHQSSQWTLIFFAAYLPWAIGAVITGLIGGLFIGPLAVFIVFAIAFTGMIKGLKASSVLHADFNSSQLARVQVLNVSILMAVRFDPNKVQYRAGDWNKISIEISDLLAKGFEILRINRKDLIEQADKNILEAHELFMRHSGPENEKVWNKAGHLIGGLVGVSRCFGLRDGPGDFEKSVERINQAIGLLRLPHKTSKISPDDYVKLILRLVDIGKVYLKRRKPGDWEKASEAFSHASDFFSVIELHIDHRLPGVFDDLLASIVALTKNLLDRNTPGDLERVHINASNAAKLLEATAHVKTPAWQSHLPLILDRILLLVYFRINRNEPHDYEMARKNLITGNALMKVGTREQVPLTQYANSLFKAIVVTLEAHELNKLNGGYRSDIEIGNELKLDFPNQFAPHYLKRFEAVSGKLMNSGRTSAGGQAENLDSSQAATTKKNKGPIDERLEEMQQLIRRDASRQEVTHHYDALIRKLTKKGALPEQLEILRLAAEYLKVSLPSISVRNGQPGASILWHKLELNEKWGLEKIGLVEGWIIYIGAYGLWLGLASVLDTNSILLGILVFGGFYIGIFVTHLFGMLDYDNEPVRPSLSWNYLLQALAATNTASFSFFPGSGPLLHAQLNRDHDMQTAPWAMLNRLVARWSFATAAPNPGDISSYPQFDDAPHPVFITAYDGPTLPETQRIIYVNKAFLAMMQSEASDWIGKNYREKNPPELADQYTRDDMDAMALKPGAHIYMPEVNESGQMFQFVQVIKLPFFDVDQKLVGVLGMFAVTEGFSLRGMNPQLKATLSAINSAAPPRLAALAETIIEKLQFAHQHLSRNELDHGFNLTTDALAMVPDLGETPKTLPIETVISILQQLVKVGASMMGHIGLAKVDELALVYSTAFKLVEDPRMETAQFFEPAAHKLVKSSYNFASMLLDRNAEGDLERAQSSLLQADNLFQRLYVRFDHLDRRHFTRIKEEYKHLLSRRLNRKDVSELVAAKEVFISASKLLEFGKERKANNHDFGTYLFYLVVRWLEAVATLPEKSEVGDPQSIISLGRKLAHDFKGKSVKRNLDSFVRSVLQLSPSSTQVPSIVSNPPLGEMMKKRKNSPPGASALWTIKGLNQKLGLENIGLIEGLLIQTYLGVFAYGVLVILPDAPTAAEIGILLSKIISVYFGIIFGAHLFGVLDNSNQPIWPSFTKKFFLRSLNATLIAAISFVPVIGPFIHRIFNNPVVESTRDVILSNGETVTVRRYEADPGLPTVFSVEAIDPQVIRELMDTRQLNLEVPDIIKGEPTRRLTQSALIEIGNAAQEKKISYEYFIGFVNWQFKGEDFYKAFPDLKGIYLFSTGYNNVDLAEAEKRGITVTSAPGPLTQAMAELNVGMLLEDYYDLQNTVFTEPEEGLVPLSQLILTPKVRASILWAQLLRTSLRLDDMYEFGRDGRFIGCGVHEEHTVFHDQLGFTPDLGLEPVLGIMGSGKLAHELFGFAKSLHSEGKPWTRYWVNIANGDEWLSKEDEKKYGLIRTPNLNDLRKKSKFILNASQTAIDPLPGHHVINEDNLYVDPLAELKLNRTLDGKTLHMLGAGQIGSRTGHMVQALGASITAMVTNPTKLEYLKLQALGWKFVGSDAESKRKFLNEAHYLLLIPKYSNALENWLDAQAINHLPSNALVINTSRGPIINEDAFVKGVQRKGIRGRLDVLVKEQEETKDRPIVKLWPMVKVSGHTGSAVRFVRRAMQRVAFFFNLLKDLANKVPQNLLTKAKSKGAEKGSAGKTTQSAAWFAHPTYVMYIAVWFEPLVAYTATALLIPADSFVSVYLFSAFTFWFPHILRGKQTLFSTEVMALAAGYGLTAVLFVYGPEIAIFSLVFLTRSHFRTNRQSGLSPENTATSPGALANGILKGMPTTLDLKSFGNEGVLVLGLDESLTPSATQTLMGQLQPLMEAVPNLPLVIATNSVQEASLSSLTGQYSNVVYAHDPTLFTQSSEGMMLHMEGVEALLEKHGYIGRKMMLATRKGLLLSWAGRIKEVLRVFFDEHFKLVDSLIERVEDGIRRNQAAKQAA